jgi:hypothetical protein
LLLQTAPRATPPRIWLRPTAVLIPGDEPGKLLFDRMPPLAAAVQPTAASLFFAGTHGIAPRSRLPHKRIGKNA